MDNPWRLVVERGAGPLSYAELTALRLELRKKPWRLVAVATLTLRETTDYKTWQEKRGRYTHHPLFGRVWHGRRVRLLAIAEELVRQHDSAMCPVTFRVE